MMRLTFPLFSALILSSGLAAAPLPGGFEHSGWYEFEVVVLINSEAEVLQSETWPLLPQPGYPSRWRWLQENTLSAEKSLTQENARMRHSLSGHTMIYEAEAPPAPWLPPSTMLTEGDLALIDELIDLGMGTSPAEREGVSSADDADSGEPLETLDTDPILPFEASAPETPATPLLSLESLVSEDPRDKFASDISVPFAPPEQRAELLPVQVAATAIPLPATFEKLPLTKLAPGLERYRRNSSDQLMAAAAWLQGPGSENLPIMLVSGDQDSYPPAQGFIQLLPRDNAWRLGLNIWANTQGEYLPDIFKMDPPPPSPPRITRVAGSAAIQPPAVTGSEDTDTSLPGGALISLSPGAMEAEDQTRGSPEQDQGVDSHQETDVAGALPPPEWPWRHLIHVADTVPLSENRLRYYDHPVIKVLAIWRELTWYELYLRGAMLREIEPPLIND